MMVRHHCRRIFCILVYKVDYIESQLAATRDDDVKPTVA
jgi:hypothetical protein